MKKIIIILLALILTSFFSASCQKAKEPEGTKQSQVQHEQMQEKNERYIEMKPSPLTEEEQKYVQGLTQGLLVTPSHKDPEMIEKYLSILLKGDHRNIKLYDGYEKLSEENKKREYGDAIASSFEVINPKSKEGFNLAIEVLKTKSEYPEALAGAVKALKNSGDKNILSILQEQDIIKNQNSTVRLAVGEALLELDDINNALPILDELIKEGSEAALSDIFYKMQGKEWEQKGIDSIKKALKNGNNEIKATAVLYLIKLTKKGELKEDLKELEKITIGIAETILSKSKWISQSRGYSDRRALTTISTIIWELDSIEALPILKRISEHPEASYLQKDAKETFVKIQIKHCIEPNFIRKSLPKSEKAYIEDSTSNIGLYQAGIFESLERFLYSMNITAQEILPSQINAGLAKRVPLLIIPTAGLEDEIPFFGTTTSSHIYNEIKSYVSNGGTVLIFSQAYGKAYSKLMEGVKALGYQEDKTCNYIEVSMVDPLPVVELISPKKFIMAFDGHFTEYPVNTKVYLKRDETNQAVAIGYPLGKGLIIATTSAAPEAVDCGKTTEDNIIFFREIFNYFKLPMKLPKVKAGQDVKIKIKVTNDDKEFTATTVEVEIYDPDRAFRRYYKTFSINLNPGASTFIEFKYHTCPTSPPGIWHVTYGLLAKMEQVLTSAMEPEGVKVIDDSVLQPSRDALDGSFIVFK